MELQPCCKHDTYKSAAHDSRKISMYIEQMTVSKIASYISRHNNKDNRECIEYKSKPWKCGYILVSDYRDKFYYAGYGDTEQCEMCQIHVYVLIIPVNPFIFSCKKNACHNGKKNSQTGEQKKKN